jgi:hypothetical protein
VKKVIEKRSLSALQVRICDRPFKELKLMEASPYAAYFYDSEFAACAGVFLGHVLDFSSNDRNMPTSSRVVELPRSPRVSVEQRHAWTDYVAPELLIRRLKETAG